MSTRSDFARRVTALVFGAAFALPWSTSVEARPLRIAVPVYQGSCEAAPPVGVVRLWRGHFSGGRYANHFDGFQHIRNRIDWADATTCFSSRQSCDSWVGSMRRAYGRIEGYWTCLPIR